MSDYTGEDVGEEMSDATFTSKLWQGPPPVCRCCHKEFDPDGESECVHMAGPHRYDPKYGYCLYCWLVGEAVTEPAVACRSGS